LRRLVDSIGDETEESADTRALRDERVPVGVSARQESSNCGSGLAPPEPVGDEAIGGEALCMFRCR
jgi:hypothetical protein